MAVGCVTILILCIASVYSIELERRTRATGGVSQDFINKFLQTINKVRAKYCARPLIWDQAAADAAQSWAEKRAKQLVSVPHGEWGTQNAFRASTPEKCAIAGHFEIFDYYNRDKVPTAMYGHFVNQNDRRLGLVGVGVAKGVETTYCIVNFDRLPNDETDYGDEKIWPNTCRLAEPTCKVDPDKREDCLWGDDDYNKEKCEKIHCCYDDTIQGKPKCFYPEDTGEVLRCELPKFAHGEEVVYSDSIGPPFKVGTVATLACQFDKGTTGLIRPSATCQKDGTWTDLKPMQKCQHYCAGPPERRIPVDMGNYPIKPENYKWFCLQKDNGANKEKFCYDPESRLCYHPFDSKKGQCGNADSSSIPSLEKFMVATFYKHPTLGSKLPFPYPEATIATLWCPGNIQTSVTCESTGTWSKLSIPCPYSCEGPTASKVPADVYDPKVPWWCDHAKEKFYCWDNQLSLCHYPIHKDGQCGPLEITEIAGREQFQRITDVVVPVSVIDKNAFPYPTGTVANVFCPDLAVKSTTTCGRDGNWGPISPACPYTCKGPVEKRGKTIPDFRPQLRSYCIEKTFYNCWDEDRKACYIPFSST